MERVGRREMMLVSLQERLAEVKVLISLYLILATQDISNPTGPQIRGGKKQKNVEPIRAGLRKCRH